MCRRERVGRADKKKAVLSKKEKKLKKKEKKEKKLKEQSGLI
jgi:hypothetical protein